MNDAVKYIEENFKVIDKEDNLIPVRLYKAQKHYIENRGNRNVCLKGRQMGFSTGVLCDNSHALFTMPYQRQTLITHDSETSEFLFQNVQRFYRNLPQNVGKSAKMMRPAHDWKSGTRMRFPVVDSYIYIDSAKSDSVGAGHTINRCHLSELAKYPEKKGRQLWADITQTVPKKGIITAESTPQGRAGIFYEIYTDAKNGVNGFTPFFYPWWWDVGYYEDPVKHITAETTENCADILGQSVESFLKEEKQMAETFELSPGQLAFRRWKIAEIKLLFFQEYPENDIDCWLSNEMSVIDGSDLRPYYPETKTGETHGDWTVWKGAVGGRKYIIGADTASGTAKDFSVAVVLDARTLEYVARIRGKINTDQFGEDLTRLGETYNNALIAVERANHGHSVLKVLLEKGYDNLYYHVDYDETTRVNVSDAGWKTTTKTKPLMVNGMIAAFRSRDLISYSENLLMEASSLVWEGGVDSRVKTVAGGFDDEFDAMAIAIQVRESTPVSGEDDYRGAQDYM